MVKRRVKNRLFVAVVVAISVCIGCGQSGDIHPSIFSNASQPQTQPNKFERPVGDELAISVNRITDSVFEVRIKNVSSRPVFSSYLPSGTSDRASYFAYITELKDRNTGEFVQFSSAGHYAPPSHSIEAGRSVIFKFSQPEAGIYRLRFSYLIDKKLYSMISQKQFLENEERDLAIEAQYELTSPEIMIKTVNDHSRRE